MRYPITIVGKLLGASLAFFGIGVFVLPAGIVASGFAEKVKDKIDPAEILQEHLFSSDRELFLESLATNQQYQQITADAKLLKYCLQTAQRELATLETDPEAINSWAMLLYIQAKQDNSQVKL